MGALLCPQNFDIVKWNISRGSGQLKNTGMQATYFTGSGNSNTLQTHYFVYFCYIELAIIMHKYAISFILASVILVDD